MATKHYEIRCPIHGFIKLEPWEWDIIHHPVVQRLRRIRQLGWTDMLYPGAMHTRFEHSLGVMHTASRMFDEVWYRQGDVLKALNFDENARHKDKCILRLATLLHDVGHAPFSHAGEEVMPVNAATGKRYKHEKYSWEIIRQLLPEIIDDHQLNKKGHNIKAEEVAGFLEANPKIGASLMFWRQLADSQLDADRADYLLRDSYHVGVEYGRYDLNRLIVSLVVGIDETENPVLAINDGGWHAAEGLIIARYMMFTQAYFHKTRRIYDYHLTETLKALLAEAHAGTMLGDCFPPPTDRENLKRYVDWTDWRVLGLLNEGKGGEHGEILRKRDHYRLLFETKDRATDADVQQIKALQVALGATPSYLDDKVKSDWYKASRADEILVTTMPDEELFKKTEPLSVRSKVVSQLQMASLAQLRLYVPETEKPKVVGLRDAFLAAQTKKGAA